MNADRFSFVIPALDEAAGIAAALAPLQLARKAGAEVIVVDGASRDATRAVAGPLADHVIGAARGRASQMAAGAAMARGDVLVFVHADTILPVDAIDAMGRALEAGDRVWGRFDVAIAGKGALLAVVAAMMNLRSRLTGIATGDQAIFVRREAYLASGGFPPIPLMEDVALSKALRARSRPACLRDRVVTSGRRWEKRGTLRTVALMWRLRLEYALGADPVAIARRYER